MLYQIASFNWHFDFKVGIVVICSHWSVLQIYGFLFGVSLFCLWKMLFKNDTKKTYSLSYVFLLFGDRLMVGQGTLNPFIKVRILVSEFFYWTYLLKNSFSFAKILFSHKMCLNRMWNHYLCIRLFIILLIIYGANNFWTSKACAVITLE